MLASMTGYGSATGAVGGWTVTVEVRSVNHRFFTPSIKLPAALAAAEPEIRDVLRQAVTRGHVTCTVRLDRVGDAGASIDEARFAAYVDRLRALRERFQLAGDVDVGTVLRLPDVVCAPDAMPGEDALAGLVSLVRAAVAELSRARREEGARLGHVIRERLATAEAAMTRVAQRAPQRVATARERLRRAVQEATQGVPVDEARLAQEIALLTDRLDVGEELDRFAMHLAAFRDTLRAPASDGVGKRLGFLLQELLREANTAGSKANDAIIQGEVIAVKEELERIREQVENLE